MSGSSSILQKLKNNFSHSNGFIDFVDLVTNNYRHRKIEPNEGDTHTYEVIEQSLCKFGVKAIECEHPNTSPTKERDPHKQYKALQWVRDTLQYRNLTDEELLKGKKTLLNHLLYISMLGENGEVISFEGNKKGFSRYNTKKRALIMDCAAEMEDVGYECFFVTTTLDPKTVGYNRLFAWQNYTAWIRDIFKNDIKHNGVKVLWVMESTKDGYPHIHMIVGYPKGAYKSYSKIQPGSKVKFGEIVNKLKHNQWFRVFEVQKPKNNGVKWYLTKYISKMTEEDIHEIGKKEEKLTDEERKFLQGLIYSTATCARLFGLPRIHGNKCKRGSSRGRMDDASKRTTMENGIYDEIYEILKSKKKLGRLRPFLRKLCTNFPCQNKQFICASNYYTAMRITDGEIDKKEQLSAEMRKKLLDNSKPLTCGGCAYVHFANLFLCGDDEVVNPVVRYEDGKPIKFIRPEDFEDDDVFIQKFIDTIRIYVNFTFDTFGKLTRDWGKPEAMADYFNTIKEGNEEQVVFYVGQASSLRNKFAKKA